jgi:hypothetical protein
MDFFGVHRCGQCGGLYGLARTAAGFVPVRCLCDGIACSVCEKRAIHRPISNYVDEQTGRIWHVPWFGFMFPCVGCRKKRAASHGLSR